jgi:hypothetical protein
MRGAGFGAPTPSPENTEAPDRDRELRGSCPSSGRSVVIRFHSAVIRVCRCSRARYCTISFRGSSLTTQRPLYMSFT